MPHGAPRAEPRIDLLIDDWPIVRMIYSGAIKPEHFRGAIKRCVELTDRAQREGTRVAWLVHLDQIRPSHITAGMRKESAELLHECLPLMAAGTRAEARVATKSVVRAMMTAMNWLVSHPWPVEIFATEAEALAWLRRQEADAAQGSAATGGRTL